MSNSIPNYVSTDAVPDHSPDNLGQAVPQNIAARPGPVVPAGSNDPRRFMYSAIHDNPNPLTQSRHTYAQVDQFRNHLDHQYRSQFTLPANFNPTFVPGTLDRATDERTEAKDFYDDYVRNELQHVPSYVFNKRAPSM